MHRNVGTVGGGPVAPTSDVEVATGAGFTNMVQAWTDVNAPAAEGRQVTVEGLSRTTAYHWRVRGTNAGDPARGRAVCSRPPIARRGATT